MEAIWSCRATEVARVTGITEVTVGQWTLESNDIMSKQRAV